MFNRYYYNHWIQEYFINSNKNAYIKIYSFHYNLSEIILHFQLYMSKMRHNNSFKWIISKVYAHFWIFHLISTSKIKEIKEQFSKEIVIVGKLFSTSHIIKVKKMNWNRYKNNKKIYNFPPQSCIWNRIPQSWVEIQYLKCKIVFNTSLQ